MTSVTIEELIRRAGEFEEKLEHCYADIRDKSENDGVRLLTYYLSRHCKHLQEAIENFNHEEIERIKKIRLKYDIEFWPEKNFRALDCSSEEIRGERLLEYAVEHETLLVSLYKSILNQPLTKEAENFFECLIRIEEKNIVMLKKMIAMDYF